MKRPSPSNRSGFTLVELLVVIAIIAILAASLLSVGASVINMAKRTKAANTATQIQTACLNYYTEYSVYPIPLPKQAATTDLFMSDTDNTDWQLLIEGLAGNISPSSPSTTVLSTTTGLNTRGIAFLTLKSSDVGTAAPDTDCPMNPITPNTTNKYFNIVMDANYDGLLGTAAPTNVMPNISLSTTSLMNTTGTSTAGVALWANCNPPGYTNPKYYVTTY